MNGKGDRPRPMLVSRREFEENWRRIFSPAGVHASACADPLGEDAKNADGRREQHGGVGGFRASTGASPLIRRGQERQQRGGTGTSAVEFGCPQCAERIMGIRCGDDVSYRAVRKRRGIAPGQAIHCCPNLRCMTLLPTLSWEQFVDLMAMAWGA